MRILSTFVYMLLSIYISLALAQTCESNNYEDTCWLRKQDSSSKLMIFVHGIDGSASETWNGKISGRAVKWPEIIAKDEIFSDVDILVANYISSSWLRRHASPSIDTLTNDFIISEISNNGVLEVDESGVTRYQDILFVAHSMGGLVVRNALIRDTELANRTKAIFTFATPTGGSQLANWLSTVSNSDSLQDMVQLFSMQYMLTENGEVEYVNSSFLHELRDSWRNDNLLSSIKSYCAYETLPSTFLGIGKLVVEKRDAELICNRVKALWGDHSAIVTPSNDWKGHSLLTSWYLEEFPDRIQYSQNQKEGDVLLVQCSTDFYKAEEYAEMQQYLNDIQAQGNFSWRFTVALPEDWRPEFKTYLRHSEKYEPSVLIMHYSCFKEEGNRTAGLHERTQDNISFLKSLKDTGVRIVFFSTAFSRNPFEVVKSDGSAGYRFYNGDGGIIITNKELENVRKLYFEDGCQRIFSVSSLINVPEDIDAFEIDFKRNVLNAVSTTCH